MSAIFEAAKAEAPAIVRTVLCQAGGVQRAINDFNGKVNPFYTGSRGEAVTRGLERALGKFCPLPPSRSPQGAVPPSGGQCAGTTYRVGFSVNTYYFDGSPGFPGTGTSSVGSSLTPPVVGPIGASWVVNERVPFTANTTRYTIFTQTGEGVVQMFSSTATNTGWSITGVSISVSGGGPDNCGNAPPGTSPPPYSPTNPRPPGNTRNVTISPSVTIPVLLTGVVGIVNVNAEGVITVPVTVTATFDAGGITNNLDFDIDVNLGDPSSPPTSPPTPHPRDDDDRPSPPDCPPPADCAPREEEDEEPDEPPIDPEDPEDKKEQEIKSVRVASIVDPDLSPATEILMAGGAPNIHVPRVGSVKFVYAVAPGIVAWSTDIDVKATNQIIPAPKTGLRCLGAVFSPARGVVGETFFTRGRRCDCD